MTTPRPAAGPHPVARTHHLVKEYHHETALGGVDLEIRGGEIHALLGLNGAGKSTLMKALVAMVAPTSGSVEVFGVPVAQAGPEQWRGVGHMIETPLAYAELTTEQNITCAAMPHGLTRHQATERAAQLLESLDLTHWRNSRAQALSQGNRQRLGIACGVGHEPKLLILDEPTSALDPRGVLLVRDLLHQLRTAGTGILISSHHLDEMARVADRITVLHRGRVAGHLPPGGHDLERKFFDMVYAADEARAAAEMRAGAA